MLTGKKKNSGEVESGVLLLAKKSGLTSFASLSSVKRILNTGKVGHTGTLDSFADGLLVVLTGKLTKLVPHITNFDKKYSALVEFGSETDTLDPTGQIVSTGKIPSKEEILSALEKFKGEIEQVPPAYSALHVDGKRASDLIREGKTVELKARKITVHSIELVDFQDKYALIEVTCSKGTYIRSLARDIAKACGTVAHLKALRRTRVGIFDLKDAVGFSDLEDFTIQNILKSSSETSFDGYDAKEVEKSLVPMSFKLAESCGMTPLTLSSYFVSAYSNGKPLNPKFFSLEEKLPDSGEIAVFYPKGKFAGVVQKDGKKLSYGFVIPPDNKLVVYSWEQVKSGQVDESLIENGTALTIGSFDGPHIGHDALFDAALRQKKERGLIPGVVTFTRSLRAMKNPAEYPGDISTLSQKLDVLASKGFAFAVVIDFSEEFGRIEGLEFLKVLLDSCRMKFLAEGKDFHCGYKGLTGMEIIKEFSEKNGFCLETVDSVVFEDKKISSTRCRNSILESDFDSANFMLDRHFSLDCSDFKWSEEKDPDNRKIVKTASISGIQIVPPDGTYKVLAVVLVQNNLISQKSGEANSSVNVRAYRSDCTLEKGNLRLAFSDKLISGFVQAIQFGYPDEK